MISYLLTSLIFAFVFVNTLKDSKFDIYHIFLFLLFFICMPLIIVAWLAWKMANESNKNE